MSTHRTIIIVAVRFRLPASQRRFPGTEAAYRAMYQMTSAQIPCGSRRLAGTFLNTRNEIFNITNGDTFRWQRMWPKIARRCSTWIMPIRSLTTPPRRRYAAGAGAQLARGAYRLRKCDSEQTGAEEEKTSNGYTEETVRSEFFVCHGTPPIVRQCWLPPASGSSRLAARLERLRLMTQLYVGTRPMPKGIGRVIPRFVMFAFHVLSF